jgi:hypothetical protein
MLLEILLVMEVLGFCFLALGIMPFKRISDNGNLPLVNKVLFIFVSAIIFFSLAVTSVSYDYTYCFINETTLADGGTSTISNATCDDYKIEDQGISYLNWGMGILAVLVGIVILLITGFSRNDVHYRED